MITLKNKDSGNLIGVISEDQLQFLVDNLEEEGDADQDYWINRDQLDFLNEEGAGAALIDMIEKAMGDQDEIEITWSKS